jgi:hypothetical protein
MATKRAMARAARAMAMATRVAGDCVCVLTWALAREDLFAILETFESRCMDPPHLAS